MTLVTGNPLGTLTSQEELYLEGAPYLYFQDANAAPLNNPDADGYYWGLSGSTTYPVLLIGCVEDVSLTEGLTMNDVRCDTVGVKDTIQKRNYVEFNLTVKSQFPLAVLKHLLGLGDAGKMTTGLEKVGIGGIDNNQKYHVYAIKVYDEITGDYLLFYLHKAKFVDAWTINFKYGEPWTTTGLKLRAYADDTKLSTMRFGTILRSDLSALP